MKATASCNFPYLNEWKTFCDKNKICAFIDSVLSGYAQLAFNDNTFSGLLMLIATWLGSSTLCINALWGTITATAYAVVIKLPKEDIRAGIYGANAALAGLAIPPLLFPSQNISFILLIVSSFVAIMTVQLIQILSRKFNKWSLPTLVAPYCITLMCFLALFTFTGMIETTPVTLKTLLFTNSLSNWSYSELITAFLNIASQILWLSNPLSGILYLTALLFASRRDTFNTIIAIIASIISFIALTP